MLIKNFLIGADIEVFLQNKTDGSIVTAEGIIKGTKKEPFNFDKADKFFATSLDNVMAEFCIPPAKTASEFYNFIQKSLKYINDNIPKELQTVALPAAEINPIYLQTENAQTFGCDPDFNAWTRLKNIPPGTSTNLRTCGGHIHIGYENSSDFLNVMLIQAMDIFVGVPSILLEPDNDRKTMYGKAGAYRDKSYGVEYRTISNFYLQNPKLTEWAYNNTVSAINFVNNGGCNTLGPEEKEEIVNCINYNNKEAALQIVEKYNIKLAA